MKAKIQDKEAPNFKSCSKISRDKSRSTFSSQKFGMTSKCPRVYIKTFGCQGYQVRPQCTQGKSSTNIYPAAARTRHPNVFIKTFGCQMNCRDSEIVAGILAKRGYAMAEREEEADVILYNTCSVRAHAENRVWGRLAIYDNQPKKKIIGVIGCMAKVYGDKIFERLPNVNLVCGPANIYDIPNLLEKLKNGTKRIAAVDKETRPENGAGGSREKKLTAFVSIMEGCDNFCSYCVVPYARGRERSRDAGEILSEIKGFIECGCKDITLLGQNVNSYKTSVKVSKCRSVNDQGQKGDFVKLLEKIDEIAVGTRIRFTTSHPKDASDELFAAMRDLPSVCGHLHLPLQSGSDRILGAMNRKYTSAHYLGVIEKLRKYLPDCAVTTDIIVGFPGESEDDFKRTKELMERIRFDSAFIFKYSQRPHTAAEKSKDDVPISVKKERNQVLLELQEEISRKRNEALIGKTVEVLVEGVNRRRARDHGPWTVDCGRIMLFGRTRANKTAIFPGGKESIGKFVNVEVTRATPHSLVGEARKA